MENTKGIPGYTGRVPWALDEAKNTSFSPATMEALTQAFSSLRRGDTDQHARAAKLFAGAAANGLDEQALPILLSCIPEGVMRGELYVDLAKAMKAAEVDAKSWHFQFLLDAACDDEHVRSEHAQAILNVCSEHFAAHHVIYADAWDKLHMLLAKIWAEPQVEALDTLVKAAHAAGVDGAAHWVELVEDAKPSASKGVAAFDRALVCGVERKCRAGELSGTDALQLLELRAKHHPALLASVECCELILLLGGGVWTLDSKLPPAFEVLGPKALSHLPSPARVLEWLKILATFDPKLPTHVLETMGKELSNKITLDHTVPKVPGARWSNQVKGQWTMAHLVELDGLFGRPVCSLDAWIAVADSEISRKPSCVMRQMDPMSWSLALDAIRSSTTDEIKFMRLRMIQQDLGTALRDAHEGTIMLSASDLQSVALLCCTVWGDEKCIALLKAIARRVCDVLVAMPATKEDGEVLCDLLGKGPLITNREVPLIIDRFFANQTWPFLRALFEEHAPAQWATLQEWARMLKECQAAPESERRTLECILASKSPNWLPIIQSAHNSLAEEGIRSVSLDARMLCLVVSCIASDPGEQELKAKAAVYLQNHFFGLSKPDREAVLAHPGVQQAMDLAVITFDLDSSWWGDLKEVFRKLTTATCEIAAERYVKACVNGGMYILEKLLVEVPPELDRPVLYRSLCEAMRSTKGDFARHFSQLLSVAACDPQLESAEALELLAGCSAYLVDHKAIGASEWYGVFLLLKTSSLPADEKAAFMVRIAGLMHVAGQDAGLTEAQAWHRVVRNTLEGKGPESVCEMAASLAKAGVTSGAAWGELLRLLLEDRAVPFSRSVELFRMFFSLPTDRQELVDLCSGLGETNFIRLFARGFWNDEDADHVAWKRLSDLLDGGVTDEFAFEIFELASNVLEHRGQLPAAVKSLLVQVVAELTEPEALHDCFLKLKSESASLSDDEDFLLQLGDQVSKVIAANPANWTVVHLARLDSALKYPLCSLMTWDAVGKDGARDLMTALAQEHLDPSRTEWLLNELLTLLATNPQQFTPDDLWDLLTFNCSLSPFSQESVQALANGACNALLNPNCPAGLIDIIGIGCWAIVISSLKRASNWPTLRRQALELATRQGLPRDSEVFIALAPPSAAWIHSMIELDRGLLASAKIRGQNSFFRLLLTCAEHADPEQKSKVKDFLAGFVWRGRTDVEELGPLTEMATRILGSAPWMALPVPTPHSKTESSDPEDKTRNSSESESRVSSDSKSDDEATSDSESSTWA